MPGSWLALSPKSAPAIFTPRSDIGAIAAVDDAEDAACDDTSDEDAKEDDRDDDARDDDWARDELARLESVLDDTCDDDICEDEACEDEVCAEDNEDEDASDDENDEDELTERDEILDETELDEMMLEESALDETLLDEIALDTSDEDWARELSELATLALLNWLLLNDATELTTGLDQATLEGTSTLPPLGLPGADEDSDPALDTEDAPNDDTDEDTRLEELCWICDEAASDSTDACALEVLGAGDLPEPPPPPQATSAPVIKGINQTDFICRSLKRRFMRSNLRAAPRSHKRASFSL